MSEEKSHSQIRQEFYETYKTKILPAIRIYEKARQETLKKTKIYSGFFIALALAIIIISAIIDVLFIKETFFLSNHAIMQMFPLIIIALVIWSWRARTFEKQIKEKIMPHICGCFCNMRWSSSTYNDGEIFKTSGVVPSFSRDSYDDIFQGVYKDVNFDIVESNLTSGSGKDETTVFDGVIVKLDMNKNFNSHTVIKPASLLPYHIPTLKRTILEDVEFEKKYDVYTNDPVDARYLITPTFMTRLNNVKTVFKAKKIRCAFYRNNLFIALSTNKDLFQFGSLTKPLDSAQQYFTAFNEIFSILTLIDYFKLDQKIGL